MDRLKIAKSLFLINLGLQLVCQASLYSKLECGHYLAQGTLKENAQAQFILSLNYRTGSSREFILVGGSIKDRLSRKNNLVQAEIYLPNATSEKVAPIVFLQNFRAEPTLQELDFISKLKPEKCRNPKLFRPSKG